VIEDRWVTILPIEFVEDDMLYLKSIVPVREEDLVLYFNHTKFKFHQGRPCKNNIVVQYRRTRTPPLFPPTT